MSTYDEVPIKRVNYGIVLNDCSEESIGAVTDLSGWTLQRATRAEAARCSQQLTMYAELGFLGKPRQQMTFTPHKSGYHATHIANKSEWRYLVVRPTEKARLNGARLSESLRLSDANLICELWNIRTKLVSSIGGDPSQCFQYLHRADVEESQTPIDFDQLAKVVRLRSELDESKYPSLVNAIKMFRDLDLIPPTPAKMLGYFGVIESLLSHAPKPNDSADSITRQLKRNLILLNNRMNDAQKIGLDEFGTTKQDKVISKLYDYRSAIAHGGDQGGKISELIKIHEGKNDIPSQLWAEQFLRRLVKRILVHSMREPQLVVDLKG